MNQINAITLQNMFLGGAKRIEANKEYINELNVFPVPDGDTGTNMSMTIMSAAKEVGALEEPTMDQLSKAIASGSLRGARGNSGVILSQLFRGFTRTIKEKDVLTTADIAEGFDLAVQTAYKAVMKPKEGTILTVARVTAERAAEVAEDTDDINLFLQRGNRSRRRYSCEDTGYASGLKRSWRSGLRRSGSCRSTERCI